MNRGIALLLSLGAHRCSVADSPIRRTTSFALDIAYESIFPGCHAPRTRGMLVRDERAPARLDVPTTDLVLRDAELGNSVELVALGTFAQRTAQKGGSSSGAARAGKPHWRWVYRAIRLVAGG